jgi:4-hydroxy-tetrahydrodipicolinate synthase
MELAGCYTALVTPFRQGQVDYAALKDLVELQIASGIDGVVPVGTTGESPTLDFDEHRRVIEFVVEAVRRRCLVIAGSGANSTAEAIDLTRHAASVGADATLQVTPYYNKPTAEGLYRHFAAVADECGLPVVLYNVPGRTGREIPVNVIARLAANPAVVAVKEAGGSVERVSAILSECNIIVLSGDDVLTLPMMVVGGKGVISVASNLIPAEVSAMVHAALAGRWDDARQAHQRLYPLFRDLFVETNPIPVKAALAMLGRIAEEYRLPLCEMGPASRKLLVASMRRAGIRCD